MRKWMMIGLTAALLLSGCHAGKQAEQGQLAENDPEILSLPVPETVQDQDTRGAWIGPPAPATAPSSPSPVPVPKPAAEDEMRASPVPVPIPVPVPAASTTPAPAPSEDRKKITAARRAEPNARLDRKKTKQASGSKAADSVNASSAKNLTLAELRQKYSGSFIFQGSTAERRIALTFDDAPDTVYTPQVLDILKRYQVKATFFVVGYRASLHPDTVRRIVREGHVVGNHSYGHSQLKKLPRSKFIQEVEKAERVLAPLAGYKPRLIRPPYGAVNDEELAWLADQGYLTVNWNVDPEDWRGFSKDVILQRSLHAAGPGSIILMHSATGTGGSLEGTVEALPDLIEGLRSKGYELVTLPVLLQSSKSK